MGDDIKTIGASLHTHDVPGLNGNLALLDSFSSGPSWTTELDHTIRTEVHERHQAIRGYINALQVSDHTDDVTKDLQELG